MNTQGVLFQPVSKICWESGVDLGFTEQELHYNGGTGAELGHEENVCSILAVQRRVETGWRKCSEANCHREGSDIVRGNGLGYEREDSV